MRHSLGSSRHAPALWRRISAAALLALQLVVAFSPIAEAQYQPPDTAHIHDQQTNHAALHDESTCAVCAVRTHIARATAPPAPVADAETPYRVAAAALPDGATRDGSLANATRGPPLTN
jgi:hypothetical protein